MSINGAMLKKLPPQYRRDLKNFSMCDFQTVTYGAELQAFKNWAQAHPEFWTYPGWGRCGDRFAREVALRVIAGSMMVSWQTTSSSGEKIMTKLGLGILAAAMLIADRARADDTG